MRPWLTIALAVIAVAEDDAIAAYVRFARTTLPKLTKAWAAPHRASAAHQNVALCTDSGHRFGRSHAFYAKADIPAHSELYFSYGQNYWSHRGVVPEDPAQE